MAMEVLVLLCFLGILDFWIFDVTGKTVPNLGKSYIYDIYSHKECSMARTDDRLSEEEYTLF